MGIRNLRADEIDVRVQSTASYLDKDKKEKAYAILLLYKDARCDMNILDEVYGITGWKRSHQEIAGRLYCTVEIWDDIKEQWINKQDVGTESNTEKEKGQASDSFKRACFNIGIGRELYTAPSLIIWLNESDYSINVKDNKKYVNLDKKLKFRVIDIGINEDKQIMSLKIADQAGKVRFESKP